MHGQNTGSRRIKMIAIGNKFPSGILFRSKKDEVDTETHFANKKFVVFGVPGAFGGTCSQEHLPGFINFTSAFNSKGYSLMCIAVNDPNVMKAWGESAGADNIDMLSDGDCSVTKALGLDKDYGRNFGIRSKRYALIVDNGVVVKIFVDESGLDATSAENLINNL